jgi:hypothetical protein
MSIKTDLLPSMLVLLLVLVFDVAEQCAKGYRKVETVGIQRAVYRDK